MKERSGARHFAEELMCESRYTTESCICDGEASISGIGDGEASISGIGVDEASNSWGNLNEVFPSEGHACERDTSARVRPRRSQSSGTWYQSELRHQYSRKRDTVEYPSLHIECLTQTVIGDAVIYIYILYTPRT